MSESFRAIVVDAQQDAEGRSRPSVALTRLTEADLRRGDAAPGEPNVLVDVEYSSLNYKDGMAVGGRPGITRTHPIVAGIDLVGAVAESGDERWAPGDRVILNGAGLSETRNGGFAERAVVDGGSLVRLPETITPRRAAAIGTAGFTAMLCVLALERHGIRPHDGEVLVTGASGGVGSVAIALLSRAGYTVAAATGRAEANGDFLRALGASTLVDRAELEEPGRPLRTQRWAAAVDSIGGVPLASVLAQVNYGGAVAACGLAASAELPTTMLPFILRSVSLLGVNSVDAPLSLRRQAWSRLAHDLDVDLLDSMTTVIGLSDVVGASADILDGRTRGRVVVDVSR